MAQGPNNINDLQTSQSAALGQQFQADQQKRKQQKGGGKSITENLIPWFISPDYDVVNSFVGGFSQAANLIPLTSLPGIIQFFKIRVSLWKEGTFIAQDDILSELDKAKQGGKKEDLVLSEKQKFDQDQNENSGMHDSKNKNAEQNQSHSSAEQNQNHGKQEHQQQDNDDSHKSYWSNVNMIANQQRMNMTNKNADNFEALEHFLKEQDRIIDGAKHQSQLIESVNRQKQQSR